MKCQTDKNKLKFHVNCLPCTQFIGNVKNVKIKLKKLELCQLQILLDILRIQEVQIFWATAIPLIAASLGVSEILIN